jgi:threonine dehydrogenase-like Zn-dependent dehydrogenase
MRALRFDGTLKLDNEAPVLHREGEALVEVLCAGICNTDLEIVKGYAGFQGILGHEFVGRVLQSPDNSLVGERVVGEINVGCNACPLCLQGDSRHCKNRTVLGIKNRDGAFAEYLSLPLRNLLVVPESVSTEEAVFVEPLAAACHILEQIEIHPFTKVAVIGDGKLAQLIIRSLAHSNCLLTVIGKHKNKLQSVSGFAKCLIQIDNDSTNFSQVTRQTGNEKFDVVIEASGSDTGLPLALSLIKPLGSIVLKSTYQGNVSLELSSAVVNEVQIIGSRCGRFEAALKLLANHSVDVQALITDTFPLADGIKAFAKATSSNSLKVLLQISSDN